MNRVRCVVGAALALVVGTTMVSCADEGETPHELQHFGYAVNSTLATSNGGSALGVSTNATALSTRLYPSVYMQGPAGQLIPNTDVATAQPLPGAHRQVIYTIAEDATYSDGQPVVCDDFLLTVTAGQMDAIFDSYLPLTSQVERVECTSGSKQLTVVFKEDEGVRWRGLFPQGTVLPAHVIADRAGMTLGEMNQALKDHDELALAEVARSWNEDFNLDRFDPAVQVSSGPYRIASVGEYGEVELVRNDHYAGDPAVIEQLILWPKGSDLTAVAAAGNLQIAEVESVEQAAFVDRDDPLNSFEVVETVGELTEQLTLGSAGAFYAPEARRAFAACVDQGAVARASSSFSGVEVPPVGVHAVKADDSVALMITDVTEPHLAVDLDQARAYSGMTVRIGYDGPDERKAAMIEEIRKSCEPAGITVVDSSDVAGGVDQLARTTVSEWGYEQVIDGPLDAVLRAVAPEYEFGSVNSASTNVEGTRASELELWEEVPSIPLASQPRVFVIDRTVGNVVVSTDLSGIGWNMDRWSVNEES